MAGMAKEREIPDNWSKVERWVWERIEAGETADFNARYGKEEPLDPSKPDGWDDEEKDRRISQAFLEAVLLDEPWHGAVPRQGVRILGGLFPEDIDLTNAKIGHEVWLAQSRFEGGLTLRTGTLCAALSIAGSSLKGDVILNGAKVGGQLNMRGSSFEGAVSMDSLEVASGLFMGEKATFKGDVILNGAKVGEHLDMRGSIFERAVNMDSAKVCGMLDMRVSGFEGAVNMGRLEVASSLFMSEKATFKGDVILNGAKVGGPLEMRGSRFEGAVTMGRLEVASSLFMSEKATFKGDVILIGAKVGGTLEMDGSSFEGPVIMDSLEVASSLFMREKATFKGDVILNGAKVGGQLNMRGSRFEGAVSMASLEVASDLFMREKAIFAKPVAITFSRIGSNLDLSGAVFATLDLSGTEITGELRLGSSEHPRTEWMGGGSLVLCHAHAGRLQGRIDDAADAWPEELQLDGFTYDRLVEFLSGGGEADMLARPVAWYIGWLNRDPTYSPQPYEQLATVFRAAGHPNEANHILYAGREREREGATGFKWWGLSVLKWTIGYGLGFRYFWSLGWVGLFVVIGAGLLWLASHLAVNVPNHGFAWSLACSLDLLLPVVELNKAHAEFVMTTVGDNPVTAWIKYYFYVHKLFGWILASFLVAGLAGLTQKS